VLKQDADDILHANKIII